MEGLSDTIEPVPTTYPRTKVLIFFSVYILMNKIITNYFISVLRPEIVEAIIAIMK